MVAAVSSTSPYAGALPQIPPQVSPQQIQQMKQNWQDLGQSIASGDLSSAKDAFSAIQDAQQQLGATPPGGANGQIAQDFSALSSALQSGDVSAAQKAFSTLQSDMKTLRPHGPGGRGHGPGGGDDADKASTADKTIANEVKQTNTNGTVTITTTYSDGSTSTVTEQNPVPVAGQGALDSSNTGQLQALLAAQERAQPSDSL